MRMPLLDRGSASRSDIQACRKLLRGGSRTFFAASLLLPPRVRQPASALYAFCRLADDAIDLDNGHMVALARLQERLDRAYAGRPLPFPVDRAFAETIARFSIPRSLPEALLEGFAWDAAGRRYEEFTELTAYAERVAGTVGAMMAVLMGRRGPETLARACELGIAMQLTNIARDVGEDARAGRIYLPLRWLREAGIEPEVWLAEPVFSDRLALVIARLLQAADRLYNHAEDGIVSLPPSCRPAIRAARLLYAEIGREVERRGFDSVSHRAAVPLHRKVRLFVRASANVAVARVPEPSPDPAQTGFLVAAWTGAPHGAFEIAGHRRSLWNIAERAIWVIDLFERLGQSDRAAVGFLQPPATETGGGQCETGPA